MSVAQAPLFLSDEAFELLVRRVPAEVLREVPEAEYPAAIGVSKQRFEEIVGALGEGGRTQGLIGPETAGYLRNALGVAILECGAEEFKERTGVDRDDAMNMLRQISARLGATPDEMGKVQ